MKGTKILSFKISENLHGELKSEAAIKHLPLYLYITNILSECLENKNKNNTKE